GGCARRARCRGDPGVGEPAVPPSRHARALPRGARTPLARRAGALRTPVREERLPAWPGAHGGARPSRAAAADHRHRGSPPGAARTPRGAGPARARDVTVSGRGARAARIARILPAFRNHGQYCPLFEPDGLPLVVTGFSVPSAIAL